MCILWARFRARARCRSAPWVPTLEGQDARADARALVVRVDAQRPGEGLSGVLVVLEVVVGRGHGGERIGVVPRTAQRSRIGFAAGLGLARQAENEPQVQVRGARLRKALGGGPRELQGLVEGAPPRQQEGQGVADPQVVGPRLERAAVRLRSRPRDSPCAP